MGKVKILLIGDAKWTSGIKDFLAAEGDEVHLEILNNELKAKARLEHNSYDVLLLQDRFVGNDTLFLASMAYAMTRPCIIITSSLIRLLGYKLWLRFSVFTNKYKISKKLIAFSYKTHGLKELIEAKSANYMQFFDGVTQEIKKNTSRFKKL